MEELKPCPFCGSRSNDPDCHDEDCYISQLLAIASALINGHKASEMEQARENLAASWNTRYEMNCHMQRLETDGIMDEFECLKCGGHTWVPIMCRPEFCCHCGAKVLDDVKLNVV